MNEGRPRYLAGGLLALLALAAFWNSFHTPFLFDDHEAIEANPTIEDIGAVWQTLKPPTTGSGVTGRPVVNFSLAINYALGGTNPFGYHLLNFIAHLGAGLALFGVVRRSLLLPGLRERFGVVALPLAWSVAAIWTLHPLQTESVTCVIQRTEVLVGLFYLLTFYCFVRSIEDPRARGWPVLAVGACLLGMASKEVMVSAPLMMLLYDRTFVAGSCREAWRQRRGLYLGLGGTWLLLGLLVAQLGGTRGTSAGIGLGISPLAYGFKQCEAIVRYFALSLWPHPLNVDYGEELSVHPIGVWFCALLLAALGIGTAVAIYRRHALGFLGAWFFVILAPSSSVIPLLTQTVAEHRMYLPLAALAVLAVLALHGALRARGAIVAGGLLVALAVLTACRNHDYRSTIAIWQDTVAKSPRNSRAHHNLGVALAQIGKRSEAIACFERALDCKPTDAAAHYSLAHELATLPDGRAPAIAHYEAALRILPEHLLARVNLASELAKSPEHVAEAMQQLEMAIRLNPASSMPHTNLASILVELPDRVPDALAHAEQAVRLEPNNPELRHNLANVLSKIPGRAPEAMAQYEQALRLRPNFFEAHYVLANVLANLPDRAPDAIRHYEEAIALRSDYGPAHYNLGVVLANHGRIAEAMREFETVLKLNPAAADARQNLELLRGLRR